jgi:predicted nucleic acid-binding protein
MGWVIDTCIWVDVERKTLAPNDVERFTGREPVSMSPLTVARLSAGVENTRDQNIKDFKDIPGLDLIAYAE